ncbi:MAG: hypothetical protein PVJ80_13480 [Gemmatimonadota bacterium]|jgi:hypothetical protein
MKWLFLVILGVVALFAAAYILASRGPRSFRAEYLRRVRREVARSGTPSSGAISEADLAPLPEPVRRYLRVTGAVGQPAPTSLRASWKGRIRATPDDPWMTFSAEQHDFVSEPSRFFHMRAKRGGLPVDVLHVYASGEASMRVRLLSLLSLVDERGPELRRTETVTVFNDICLLAPGALVDPSILWEEVDATTVRARFTSGPDEIGATLVFDDEGYLVDFVSDDRLAVTSDGTKHAWRWSTPVADYERYGPILAASRGEGVWHAPDGAFAYIELELVDLELNGAGP